LEVLENSRRTLEELWVYFVRSVEATVQASQNATVRIYRGL